jgi:hypothetical protein
MRVYIEVLKTGELLGQNIDLIIQQNAMDTVYAICPKIERLLIFSSVRWFS